MMQQIFGVSTTIVVSMSLINKCCGYRCGGIHQLVQWFSLSQPITKASTDKTGPLDLI